MRRSLHRLATLKPARADLLAADVPILPFLWPVLREQTRTSSRAHARAISTSTRRNNAEPGTTTAASSTPQVARPLARSLPYSCPGCGAPTQTVVPHEAGFYSPSRGAVKAYLHPVKDEAKKESQAAEDDIVEAALGNLDESLREQLGLSRETGDSKKSAPSPAAPETPVCDRCHQLIHHSTGVPIHHPSIDSIKATIEESPYKRNHIYHVIDAADFPMSLVPNLARALSLSPLRSQNRRAKNREFHDGRVAEVSFIITRSDLLAPKKEQVDGLMAYVTEVLRDALGRTGKNTRLGNVRLVSARRDWWTKEIKEKIWERGGGGWLVGKVNVGKSNLFEHIFPKGRSEDVAAKKRESAAKKAALGENGLPEPAKFAGVEDGSKEPMPEAIPEEDEDVAPEDELLDENSLLPPRQPETQYPVMPVISSLPGTTASPIRVPFGKGRGELIDLPGLARSKLETYVQEAHRPSLIMDKRIVPERITIKPGSSLLLGGLIRITPTTRDVIYLAHPFVPIKAHLTSTEKAIEIQRGTRKTVGEQIGSIAAPSAAEKMKHAARFQLKWDVTKAQAGPLTRKDAVGLKASQLRFQIWAADILVEGVGWVEIQAQTRKSKPIVRAEAKYDPKDAFAEPQLEEVPFPEIDVFSPEGRFVGIRRPMNGFLLGGPLKSKNAKPGARPRISMKSVKARRAPKTREERGLEYSHRV